MLTLPDRFRTAWTRRPAGSAPTKRFAHYARTTSAKAKSRARVPVLQRQWFLRHSLRLGWSARRLRGELLSRLRNGSTRRWNSDHPTRNLLARGATDGTTSERDLPATRPRHRQRHHRRHGGTPSRIRRRSGTAQVLPRRLGPYRPLA